MLPEADQSWVAYPLSAGPGCHTCRKSNIRPKASRRSASASSSRTPPARSGLMGSFLASIRLTSRSRLAEIGQDTGLIFWPRTSSPRCCRANRREAGGPVRQNPAYRRADVAATHSAVAIRLRSGSWQAIFIALVSRPISAVANRYDPVSRLEPHRLANVLRRKHEAADYLYYVGYNGTMLNVAPKGARSIPSKLIQPTRRISTRNFLRRGNDPMCKDVLELSCDFFTGSSSSFIPTLAFARRFPNSKRSCAAGGPSADGIQLVGPGA